MSSKVIADKSSGSNGSAARGLRLTPGALPASWSGLGEAPEDRRGRAVPDWNAPVLACCFHPNRNQRDAMHWQSSTSPLTHPPEEPTDQTRSSPEQLLERGVCRRGR